MNQIRIRIFLALFHLNAETLPHMRFEQHAGLIDVFSLLSIDTHYAADVDTIGRSYQSELRAGMAEANTVFVLPAFRGDLDINDIAIPSDREVPRRIQPDHDFRTNVVETVDCLA